MSGFDPSWLDLREPVDHRSLAAGPLERLTATFGGAPVSVADLGAGSGSALRALAPRLGRSQRWTLIDSDPALLAHARLRLRAWADAVEGDGETLRLNKAGATIHVAFLAEELARDHFPQAAAAADLVVASAFFDLAGEAWLAAFIERLAAAQNTLYAPLIYDGLKRFAPAHDLDQAVLVAFNDHQRSEKGLGPALGPDAARRLAELAGAQGYRATAAASPWRLGAADRSLTEALVRGMASAAAQLPAAPDALPKWQAFRLGAAAGGGAVGHVDLLLTPPGS
ncbi:class I SAM-dependent methyltransferase [Hansschlegelia sp.]|uniref:class I SAM-dependent methyltransferase n=1 Tax=Hansschlegelia sp. TaxID=2041892 RepID=UPI002CD5E26C|nr:class I SAM-dependent methyltransferase [Hansschlegelia sp.]HVI27258.1 class I SAM-dependent methyltransferase [Hansschlegelia sp.]